MNVTDKHGTVTRRKHSLSLGGTGRLTFYPGATVVFHHVRLPELYFIISSI
jgi:hypothetical protein